MNPFVDVLERHPDLGVDERHIRGILSDWFENNILVANVVVGFVREGWRCTVVWLIMRESIAGVRSGS